MWLQNIYLDATCSNQPSHLGLLWWYKFATSECLEQGLGLGLEMGWERDWISEWLSGHQFGQSNRLVAFRLLRGVYLDYWAVAKSERRWTSNSHSSSSSLWTRSCRSLDTRQLKLHIHRALWQKRSGTELTDWLTDWLMKQVQGYCANCDDGHHGVCL